MKTIDSVLRTDLCSFIEKTFYTLNPNTQFVPNWHIERIAELLEAATKGEIRRLVINLPPRYLKSICTSVAWPAWLLGQDPSRRIIVASHSGALSTKLSLDTRKVMQASWYKKIFPNTKFAKDQNEKTKFMTTEFGFRIASSVHAGITGEGGNFLIVDDPISPEDAMSDNERRKTLEWYDQTFSTRLDDKKNGVIVAAMQRLHEDDLAGTLIRRGGWEVLSLPIIDESGNYLHQEREGKAEVERIRQDIGEYAFAAQYMQDPVKTDGTIIKREWLKFYEKMPEDILGIFQSWDTAIKTGSNSDYSVCATFVETKNGYFLVDLFRDKLAFPDLKRAVCAQAEKWKPQAVLIEDKASGQSLIQDLRVETSLPIIAQVPTMDKLSRLASVSPMIEAGRVLFPNFEIWYKNLEVEMLSFPRGKNDDMVDAISQFLGWVRKKASVEPRVRGV